MSKADDTGRKAWVTLITDKTYVPGCLVLLSSLKHYGTKYPFVAMVPPSGSEYDERLPEEYREYSPTLVVSYEKLNGWFLQAVDTPRVVLIDSDMLTRKNMDELFVLPLQDGWIAACHACTCNPMRIPHYPSYWIPANCGHTYATPAETGTDALCIATQPNSESPPTLHSINSGIVVLHPSDEAHTKLVHALHTDPEVTNYGFPDQDFLSNYFKHRVKFLGYEYNALKPMRNCHDKLWRDEGVRNCHYIFRDKPWVIPEGSDTLDEQFHVVHGWWWDEWKRLEAKFKGSKWWGLVTKLVAVQVPRNVS